VLTDFLESAREDFFFKHILPSPYVVKCPIAAFALDPNEVNHKKLGPWLHRFMYRPHRFEGKLEVMVRVTDIDGIHGILRDF
jgi:hypothetical protein